MRNVVPLGDTPASNENFDPSGVVKVRTNVAYSSSIACYAASAKILSNNSDEEHFAWLRISIYG